MERTILHSDLNSCYASIECMLNPSLKGKPVAVGGSEEDRHGIILAKSIEAKKCGVKTGDVIWEAKRKCPDLIVIPPHFESYIKYTGFVKEIYKRFTDKIEPFGLDECWLDVSGSVGIFGNGSEIAYIIKETVKAELGLTVSIGISFNKIFAKLGSDMKKPDAITVISKENFKQKVWCQPAYAMLGCGKSTTNMLAKYGIYTIGDIANTAEAQMKVLLGKCGGELWIFANGYDNSEVKPDGFCMPVKSIGHGITCTCDLIDSKEVWRVFLQLSQDISAKLKKLKLASCSIQITIKDNTLKTKEYQSPLKIPTQSAIEIAKAATKLFNDNYNWMNDVRSLTVRAIKLQNSAIPTQLDLFNDFKKHEQQEKIDNAVMKIRDRFGNEGIFNACLLLENKIPQHNHDKSIMPSHMFK